MNKKGGFGAKLILILILMIASAVGGAYGYRILDTKLAIKDASSEVKHIVDVDDYDSAEQKDVNDLIDEFNTDLTSLTSRKAVYERFDDLKKDIGRIKTSEEKKAEAQAAQQQNYNNNNQNNTDNSQNSTDNSSNEEKSSGGFFTFKSDNETNDTN